MNSKSSRLRNISELSQETFWLRGSAFRQSDARGRLLRWCRRTFSYVRTQFTDEPEDLCFNAQQAAEKALKAVCIARGLDFPKTHSLVHLMDILETEGLDIPASVRDSDILTQYAVQSRYPSIVEEISRDEYRDVLKLASQVVFWAETIVK